MAQQVSMVRKSLILSLVVGMVVGMGNGSVFGIYLMANLGRGNFAEWGGWGWQSYNPFGYFNGFMTWVMLVFGVAFIWILLSAIYGHDKMSKAGVGSGH
ncbi:MAG: hypothetical protein ACLGGU_00245 [Gammaproteobacteria bacterium]